MLQRRGMREGFLVRSWPRVTSPRHPLRSVRALVIYRMRCVDLIYARVPRGAPTSHRWEESITRGSPTRRFFRFIRFNRFIRFIRFNRTGHHGEVACRPWAVVARRVLVRWATRRPQLLTRHRSPASLEHPNRHPPAFSHRRSNLHPAGSHLYEYIRSSRSLPEGCRGEG